MEATYQVGEYDIVILSANSRTVWRPGSWSNGYRIPAGASRALKPYIRQQMKFFVAKVNLKEQARTGSDLSAPAAVRLRVAQVHAAASAWGWSTRAGRKT